MGLVGAFLLEQYLAGRVRFLRIGEWEQCQPRHCLRIGGWRVGAMTQPSETQS